MKVSNSGGFTLIELLVVMAIVSLLSSVSLAALGTARMRSRDAARIANARQIITALHIFDIDNGSYEVTGTGYQNTGGGLMGKSGTVDYTTSILSGLKSRGYLQTENIIDPVYGDENYYLGLCNPPKKYNLYLKLEQPELQSAQSYLTAGCDSTNALALGFNFVEGVGLDVASSSPIGGGELPVQEPITTTVTVGAVGSTASAGVLTASSQIALSTGNTAYVAGGSVAGLGTSLSANVSFGAHTLQRPDGKYLTFYGGNSASTIYNPTTNSFSAGPAAPYITNTGAQSFLRDDGLFAVISAGTTGTGLYNPTSNTFAAGPSTPTTQYSLTHSIRLANGNALVFSNASALGTYFFTASTNTFAAGPNTTFATAGAGMHTIARPDGTFLVFAGANTTATNIYNPTTNTFANGPAFSNGGISGGAHSIGLHNGKYYVIAGGNSTRTAYYDPVANSFSAAPALPISASTGSHSIPIADGTFLIVCGNNSTATFLFNPYANAIALGPTLPFSANYGSHSFQRPDGKFVIIAGGGTTAAALYNGGWNMSGTYTSEDINVPTMSASSTLQYTVGGSGVAKIEIKTAATQAGLTAATYRTITPGGNIGATEGHVWARILVTLTRDIPTMPQTPSVWTGDRTTRYLRTQTTPTVSEISIVS